MSLTVVLQVESIASVRETFCLLFYYSSKSNKITPFLQTSHQGFLFPIDFQCRFPHH